MSYSNITRRNWIKTIPGAAAIVAGAGVAQAQLYRIGGATIKLGIASYSFRKYTREQAIQMTHELGTPYLNVKDFHLSLKSTPEKSTPQKSNLRTRVSSWLDAAIFRSIKTTMPIFGRSSNTRNGPVSP